jgi:hypothetical protein
MDDVGHGFLAYVEFGRIGQLEEKNSPLKSGDKIAIGCKTTLMPAAKTGNWISNSQGDESPSLPTLKKIYLVVKC